MADDLNLQAKVRDFACDDNACIARFDLQSPDCAYGPPGTVRPDAMAHVECRILRSDCAATAEGAITSATWREAEACVRQAMAPMSRVGPCPRPEPISDPVAPSPPPALRAGVDLGSGWQFDDEELQKPLLLMGVSTDWRIVPALTVGIRVGYLGAAGNAVDLDHDGSRETNTANLHALETSLRTRFRLGDEVRRLELEAALTRRFVIGGEIPSHFAWDVGAIVFLARFGIGVRYARALEGTRVNNAVLVTTERNTPLDVDPRGMFGSGSASKSPRVGLGLHALVTGWGFAEHVGPLLPGAAIELPVSFGGPIAPVVRYDVMWFPALDASAFVAQSVLAGVDYLQFGDLPVGCDVLLGYSVVDGSSPRVIDGGPVVDGGVFYWLDPLGVHLGLNGRFGVTERNQELRALYLSLGARQIF
jgi:hypothetical protein